MSSPTTEDVAMDVPEEVADEEELGKSGHGGPRVSAAAAAAVVGAEADGDEAKRPEDQLVCCICMETWTCNGAHRICCIPCGHVYGRSCLEKWFHCCGMPNAKCPQCGEPFSLDKIMNLYAPGNIWDGCCRMQELEALLVELRVQSAESHKMVAELKADLKSVVHDSAAKRNVMETAFMNALDRIDEFVSMKEPMEKMVEQNATPTDLIGFVEQNCRKLVQRIGKHLKPIMMDD
ncbi:hypothetical protein EJB05_06420 [Eragrostis curvula]|uniref:RING-type domain-containing protein n=1 Tax=Eragrostis curvula TaxID=38414 RepID=A0A5J9WF66_9POAL|nr:hypothetical protein EJB05_06420 [Eragrostis curvula]